MKRDMDLVREILFAVEAADGYLPDLKVEGHDDTIVAKHVELLTEKGYLIAKVVHSMGSNVEIAIIERLTWDGHDLVQAMRTPGVFERLKSMTKENAAEVVLDAAKQLVGGYIKKKTGLE